MPTLPATISHFCLFFVLCGFSCFVFLTQWGYFFLILVQTGAFPAASGPCPRYQPPKGHSLLLLLQCTPLKSHFNLLGLKKSHPASLLQLSPPRLDQLEKYQREKLLTESSKEYCGKHFCACILLLVQKI